MFEHDQPQHPAQLRARPPTGASLQGTVTRALAELILGGTLAEGTLLPNESELMARFNMSRTVLREAVKTLAAKGLVEARARIGTRVLGPERWHMFDPDLLAWRMALGPDRRFQADLFEVRRAIEPAAAAFAAVRRRDPHLVRMNAALEGMARDGHTARSFAEDDLEFHLAVLDASGNPLMRGIGAVIEIALVSSFSLSSPIDAPGMQARSVRMHREIADAIAVQDAPAASIAMDTVIRDAAIRHGWDSDARS